MASTRISSGAASVNNTLAQNATSYLTWFAMATGADGQTSSISSYRSIAVDTNNNVYYGMENNSKGCIVKYSSAGVQVKFVRSTNAGAFQALASDSSNNIYAAKPYVPDTASGFTMTKFDSDLNKIWQFNYDWGTTSQNPQVRSIKIDSSGGVGYLAVGGNPQYWGIVKFNLSTGAVVTTYSFSVNADENYAIDVDSSGNIYFGGQSNSGVFYSPHMHKLNSAGTWGWGKYMNTNSGYSYPSGYVYDIKVAPDGSVYFAGNYQITSTLYRNFLVKVNSAGTVQWKRNVTAAGGTNQYAGGGYMDIDSSGNIYVIFRAYNNTTGSRNALVKFDSSGNTVWQRILYNPSTGDNIESGAVKLDSTGSNLYVSFYTSLGTSYACILKIPTDGTKTGTYAAGGANAIVYAAGSNTISDATDSSVSNVSSAPGTASLTTTASNYRIENIVPFPGVTSYVTPIA